MDWDLVGNAGCATHQVIHHAAQSLTENTVIERRWERIIPHIKEFQSHLAKHVPELRIEFANDNTWSNDQYKEQRKSGIYSRFGVYLMFDNAECLEYVGVAMNSFDDRIWSHRTFVERRYTDVIAIPHQFYFLGLALEFFLICRLQPPKNTTYKGYTIPQLEVELPAPQSP